MSRARKTPTRRRRALPPYRRPTDAQVDRLHRRLMDEALDRDENIAPWQLAALRDLAFRQLRSGLNPERFPAS